MSSSVTTRAEAAEAFARCSNAGRWGDEDELGTLNLITPKVRRRAASLVIEGVSVSLGSDVDPDPRSFFQAFHRLPFLADASLLWRAALTTVRA